MSRPEPTLKRRLIADLEPHIFAIIADRAAANRRTLVAELTIILEESAAQTHQVEASHS